MEILTPKLSVRDLNKSYCGKDVLRNISFDVSDGEFLSILGPSGCGKTTLLRILIGLEQQDSGTIVMKGREISHIPSAKRGMGMVFQNYALFPNMTVLQNVEYALSIRRDMGKKARSLALQTIETVGLTDQISKLPHQLSGGQQQRVAIARTLATSPEMILLDEPISALDVENREIMKAELKELQEKLKITMLLITHDQEEAFFLSDRILIMHNGGVEQLDTPLEIYRHPVSDYVRSSVVEHLDRKHRDYLRFTGRV